MLRRTICGVLAASVGLGALALTTAGAAVTRPKLVFKTELTWTRTATVFVTSGETGLECRAAVHVAARSAPFYTARSRAPRNRHIRFGTSPNAPAMLTGRGYNPDRLRVAGSATLELGETSCNDGRVDRSCAGVYRASLELAQIFLSIDETRAVKLNWAHRAPNPPLPSEACRTAPETVFMVGGVAMTLFFRRGFDGHSGLFHSVPFPRDSLLTRRALTTTGEQPELSPPFDVRGTTRTTATFRRVR